MSFVDRLPRPEPLRQIPPLHAGPHPVEHPVDHPAVVAPPATTRATRRQERLQPIPLRIRQITTDHTASLAPTPHPRVEIRETVPKREAPSSWPSVGPGGPRKRGARLLWQVVIHPGARVPNHRLEPPPLPALAGPRAGSRRRAPRGCGSRLSQGLPRRASAGLPLSVALGSGHQLFPMSEGPSPRVPSPGPCARA